VETLFYAGISNAVTATFLALLVASLGRVVVRRPAILHCLWLLVLVKLVTPPLFQIPIPWPAALAEILEPAPTPVAVLEGPAVGMGQYALALPEAIERPELRIDALILEPVPGADPGAPVTQSGAAGAVLSEWLPADWMSLLAVGWLLGTMAVLAVSARRVWRFQHLLHEAQPASVETQEWVNELASALGLVRPPLVWWIDGNLSPMVWALGLRARLIIPTALWKSLDERQRSTLIVHELAHLRRGDHLVRILEFIVTALFWWHPVVWWARRALHDVEEQCCDAWVVWACPESAKSYAETLLETLDFLNQSDQPVPLFASGFGKVHHLRKRLTMIMSGTTPRLLGVRGALASLGMAALLLPLSATWAQQPDQKQEIRVIVKTDDDNAKPKGAAGAILELDADDLNAVETSARADLVLNVEAEAVGVQDSDHPNVVHLEVKTDDSSVSVTADSMKEAIAKLKEQIKMLMAKSSPAEREKAKKAMDRVLKDLEEQIAKQGKSGEHGAFTIEKGPAIRHLNLIEKRVEHSGRKELSPEAKAEIEKARAEVKELARSLEANQRKLREAQRRLSQLEGGNQQIAVEVHALPKVARLARLPEVIHAPLSEDIVVFSNKAHARAKSSDKKAAEAKRVIVRERVEKRDGSDANESRIEELEKKLQALLEEVASLKKARAK
jgi:beta-lactamase regulating signal transducer with metallopeptidase domain